MNGAHFISNIINNIKRLFHYRQPLGGIIMLHRVDSPKQEGVWYNQHLKIGTNTISNMVEYARNKGCEFVTLEELLYPRKLFCHRRKRIAITLDDGYRDNFTNGLPTFKTLNIPFCIYICTDMVEGKMIYWWKILEQIIVRENEVKIIKPNGNIQIYDCTTKEKKEQAFLDIREEILHLPQDELLVQLKKMFEKYDVNWEMGNDSLGLTWSQIEQLSQEPLCTIGNHTRSHKAFVGCSNEEILKDIDAANNSLHKHTGIRPVHFAFPFGEASAVSRHDIDLVKSLGFKTSATTNHGLVTRKTDPLELPRLFVTERNWREVIDFIVDNC